jgi:hypothetical protein
MRVRLFGFSEDIAGSIVARFRAQSVPRPQEVEARAAKVCTPARSICAALLAPGF